MNYQQIPGDVSAIVWRDDKGNSGVIREGDEGWAEYIQWCELGNTAQSFYQPIGGGAQAELAWRDAELARVDQEIFKHEDQDDLAIASEEAWRRYRIALRAWPQEAAFPDPTQRPVGPVAP